MVHCRGSCPHTEVLRNLLSDELERKCINLLTGGISRESPGANDSEEISSRDRDKGLLHLESVISAQKLDFQLIPFDPIAVFFRAFLDHQGSLSSRQAY